MSKSITIANFRQISSELDQRNEKAERMVKLSRDITIDSKKVIFLLHRALLQSTIEKPKSIKKAEELLQKLRNYNFRTLARELKNESPYYFNRSFTAGVQEYIEAVSFLQYLKDETLVSHHDVQQGLVFEDDDQKENVMDTNTPDVTCKNVPEEGEPVKKKAQIAVHISQYEYVLGLLDLTGELMRAGINSVAGKGHLEFNLKTMKFLQLLHEGFVESTGIQSNGRQKKELSRKLSTLLSSLIKLENYSYNLTIRETFDGVSAGTPIFFDSLYESRGDNFNDHNYDSGLD